MNLKQLYDTAVLYVNEAERLIGAGRGKDKLDYVKAALRVAFIAAGGSAAKFDAMWPVLAAVVSGLVELYNLIGAFVKTGK